MFAFLQSALSSIIEDSGFGKVRWVRLRRARTTLLLVFNGINRLSYHFVEDLKTMRRLIRFMPLAGVCLFAVAASLPAGNWAQFRGPNATGRAERDDPLPDQISPVYYRGQLFMIRNGGVLAVVDAKTGAPLKQGRISVTGDYFSSPVAGDGKVFMINQRGQLTVLDAAPGWREISSADFGEDTYASPAIVDGRIFVRTSGHLYCFGLPETQP